MLGEKIFFLIGFIKEPEEPRSDSLLFVAVIVFDERSVEGNPHSCSTRKCVLHFHRLDIILDAAHFNGAILRCLHFGLLSGFFSVKVQNRQFEAFCVVAVQYINVPFLRAHKACAV